MERSALKAGAFIALLAFSWAAPISGAALSHVLRQERTRSVSTAAAGSKLSLPGAQAPARLRQVSGRGLVVNVWLNQSGPYAFAVDTGAGVTVVSAPAARGAGLVPNSRGSVEIGGLSNTFVSGQETVLNELSIGEITNTVAIGHKALIVPTLPQGIDGILDPTEAFAPLGYVIDIPGKELRALDKGTKLRMGEEPPGGTVVRWIRQAHDGRPFVRLGDNRLALIDTGSGFALAVIGTVAGANGPNEPRKTSVHDLNGGSFTARKVGPTTVSVGSLVLRNVPTEVLSDTHFAAPVILGRGALYPFRITFDPASKLIEIAPVGAN